MASNLQLRISRFQRDHELDGSTCRMTLMEAREMELATQFMGNEFEPEEESDTELHRSFVSDLSSTSFGSSDELLSQTTVGIDRGVEFGDKWEQVTSREELEVSYAVYIESLWAQQRTLIAGDKDSEDGESDSEDTLSGLPDLIDLSGHYDEADDAAYHRCEGLDVCTGCIHCHPFTYFDETL